MKLPFKNIGHMLEKQADSFQDKTIIRFDDWNISYTELEDRSSRVASMLIDLGVQKGDRVCLMMDNSPEFLFTYFGIIRAGAIAGPINCWWQDREISYLLNDSAAVALVFDAAYRDRIDKLGPDASALKHIIERDGADDRYISYQSLIEKRGSEPLPEIGLDDVSTIVYTSGTTGNPKGVLLTHGNILTNSWQAGKLASISKNDVVLCFLPLFHVNGLVITGIAPIFAGAQIILRKNFSATEFWECVSKYGVTIFSGVPTIYQILLATPFDEKLDLSSLRYGVCGAAPMPVDTIQKFENQFNMTIIEGYGLTEGTAGATANPIDGVRKIGSIGVPFAESSVKLFDDDDNEVPQGEVGEIVIQGGNVMKGYFNQPEETAKTLRGGWLHTGDMAYQDKDGYFFIVDRKKEMIIRGGENIYPKEVEEIIFSHPKVQEVAVVGIPDDMYGEEVMACLVPVPGATINSEEFRAWCRENMASYKVPKYVDVREALPKNILGKILKKELKTELAKEGKVNTAGSKREQPA